MSKQANGPSPVAPIRQAKNASSDREAPRANQRRDVQVQLQYLKDDPLYQTTKPLQITPNFADIEGKSNVRLAPGALETITDVRGSDTPFSLDDHGFKYVKAPTAVKDWISQPKIAAEYLPEMESLLRKEVDGCEEIMFYDARIRQEADGGVRVQGLSFNPFARQVHTDNTEISVVAKVRNLTDMKADFLLSGRVRAINIWRPIKHPVHDCPLAVADGGKLEEGDVVECDRHRHDTGEFWDTMGVIKYRPGFKWHFMSEQTESDVLLFKNWDSATHVPARWCLHTAFDMPEESVAPNAPTRESIEVRALVFTYPKNAAPPSISAGTAIQQPLAESLRREHLLTLFGDEERSIADRPRLDIDATLIELKDAELLLRRQRIRHLERIVQDREVKLKASHCERSILKSRLETVEKQLDVKTSVISALEAQVKGLKRSSPTPSSTESLAAELDTALYEQTHPRTEADGLAWVQELHGPGAETMILRQTIEAQRLEIQRLKHRPAANITVDRMWQGSVDEAVKRERVKDGFVVRVLREAIKKQSGEAALQGLPHVVVDERAFSSQAEEEDCEIAALRERLAGLFGEKV